MWLGSLSRATLHEHGSSESHVAVDALYGIAVEVALGNRHVSVSNEHASASQKGLVGPSVQSAAGKVEPNQLNNVRMQERVDVNHTPLGVARTGCIQDGSAWHFSLKYHGASDADGRPVVEFVSSAAD